MIILTIQRVLWLKIQKHTIFSCYSSIVLNTMYLHNTVLKSVKLQVGSGRSRGGGGHETSGRKWQIQGRGWA